MATSEGKGVEVFHWFTVPAILKVDNSSDWVSNLHAGLAWTLIILVLLHSAAALKHHFIDKDKTLLKMLKSLKGD